eukprot:gb/GEZN01006092.1/.p1 GENE.gb/GEZN01006092.1/~~gb/GEZN01006092.1/.p1  ORF type:complete len:475 (+),score=69.35 gb/GEZN01006092.1/:137-1561(+)
MLGGDIYTSDSEEDFVPDFFDRKGVAVPDAIQEETSYPLSPTVGSFLCHICNSLFKTMQNHGQACEFHFGQWSDQDDGWTCCSQKQKLAPGCKRGWHQDSEQDVTCDFCMASLKAKDQQHHRDEECVNFPKSPVANKSGTTLCERCNHIFARSANREEACTFHPGELSYATKQAVARRWSCCGLLEGTENEWSQGCVHSFHLDANRAVVCVHCKGLVPKPLMGTHVQEECTKSPDRALQSCPYCIQQIPQSAMDRHHQTSCKKYPSVNCPNRLEGCPSQMLQEMIAPHLLNCIARKVVCPLQSAGCTETVSLNKIEAHISGDMANHFMMMWGEFSKLQTKLKHLEADNADLKSGLQSAAASVANSPRDGVANRILDEAKKREKQNKSTEPVEASPATPEKVNVTSSQGSETVLVPGTPLPALEDNVDLGAPTPESDKSKVASIVAAAEKNKDEAAAAAGEKKKKKSTKGKSKSK